MFDDTHSPFEDNCRNSADYRAFLEAEGRKKVLEGCLEEVAAGGDGLDESACTNPDQIEQFLERTGFELVVPNIGTESINAQLRSQWVPACEAHVHQELQSLPNFSAASTDMDMYSTSRAPRVLKQLALLMQVILCSAA